MDPTQLMVEPDLFFSGMIEVLKKLLTIFSGMLYNKIFKKITYSHCNELIYFVLL